MIIGQHPAIYFGVYTAPDGSRWTSKQQYEKFLRDQPPSPGDSEGGKTGGERKHNRNSTGRTGSKGVPYDK